MNLSSRPDPVAKPVTVNLVFAAARPVETLMMALIQAGLPRADAAHIVSVKVDATSQAQVEVYHLGLNGQVQVNLVTQQPLTKVITLNLL